jgi:hypothetical protein
MANFAYKDYREERLRKFQIVLLVIRVKLFYLKRRRKHRGADKRLLNYIRCAFTFLGANSSGFLVRTPNKRKLPIS